jgi:hypothetical protein
MLIAFTSEATMEPFTSIDLCVVRTLHIGSEWCVPLEILQPFELDQQIVMRLE